jgi:serine/threonine protein kinase
MGAVFKARDRELGRKVAVKVMLPLASSTARRRFQREAEAVARVEHPGVVRVFDSGLVEGRRRATSAGWRRRSPRPWRLSTRPG